MFLKEYNPRRQNLSWFKLNSVQFSSCFRSLDAADLRNVARIELPGSEERRRSARLWKHETTLRLYRRVTVLINPVGLCARLAVVTPHVMEKHADFSKTQNHNFMWQKTSASWFVLCASPCFLLPEQTDLSRISQWCFVRFKTSLLSQLVDVHPVTHRGHPLVVMATGLCADGCCADVIIQHSL